MFDDLEDEQIDSLVDELLSTEEGRHYFKDNFGNYKSRILKVKSTTSVGSFFNTIKKISGVPELKEEYEDYSFWMGLYDLIGANYQGQIDIGELLELSYKKDSESKANFENIIKTLGKYAAFSQIIAASKEEREEKRAIIEAVSKQDSMEYVGGGASGVVFRTGNKIFKLGYTKIKYEIPYHPRIMMPQFRKRYENGSQLEVYNLGNSKSPKITDEALLEIYKELESAGIIWTDAKKDNLVELVEDNNIPDYNVGEDFNLYGFLGDENYPTTNHTALKKGDIVICDLDNLYLKNDPLAAICIGMPDDVIVNYREEQEEQEKRKVRKTKEEDNGR